MINRGAGYSAAGKEDTPKGALSPERAAFWGAGEYPAHCRERASLSRRAIHLVDFFVFYSVFVGGSRAAFFFYGAAINRITMRV